MDIYDKMNEVLEVVEDLVCDKIDEDEALYRLRSLICPRPKPTPEDIAWAEKRAEELEEEKKDVLKDDHELRAASYRDLLQEGLKLFDTDLEPCTPAWIWAMSVRRALHELEYDHGN